MSASITIGSLSLASDGVTLTGTLSGGTGTGYAPASGITGLTVNAGGLTFAQTSTAISSATIAIVLTNRISSDLTPTFTISSGSNLTDSGSNTAQGQTNVAVTNSSTQKPFKFSAGWIRNGDRKTILVYFSKTDNQGYQGSATTGWTVTVNGVSQSFTATSGFAVTNDFNSDANKIVLASAAATGATVVVSYDGTVGTARDSNNIVLQSFTTPALYTSFPLSQSGVTVFGSLDNPTGAGLQHFINFQTQIWFTATGTDLKFVQQAWGTTYLTNVDGTDGTLTVSSSPLGQLTTTAVIASGTDTAHTVKLIVGSDNAQLFTDDFFLVAGSAPAIGANAAAPIPINLYSPPSHVRVDGSWMPVLAVGDNPHYVASVGTMGEITFRVKLGTGVLRIYALTGNSNALYRLIVDDDYAGFTTVTPTVARSGDNILVLATGLDTAASHKYSLQSYNTGQFVTQLLLDPSDVIDTTPQPFRFTMVADGDSITTGAGGPGASNEYLGWPWLVSRNLGYACAMMGASGLLLDGNTNPFANGTPQVSNIIAFVEAFGYNDAAAALATSTFTADEQAIIGNASPYLATAGKYYSLDLWPASGAAVDTATLNTYSAAKRTGVTNAANAKAASYQTITAFEPVASGAAPHPNGFGVLQLASEMTAKLSTHAYSVTGPTTATLSTPSTAFTVTFSSGAYFNGLQTVTATSSVSGDTFTPSIGSPATHTITSTPANNASGYTFTLTPSTAGPRTITLSNGQGWNDASSLSITASSGVATGYAVTSPAPGNPNVQSPAGTITLNGPSNGSSSVTVTSGITTDSFNTSTGATGVGAVTVLFANGTSTANYYLTRSAIATGLLIYTNNSGFSNPANGSYQTVMPTATGYSLYPTSIAAAGGVFNGSQSVTIASSNTSDLLIIGANSGTGTVTAIFANQSTGAAIVLKNYTGTPSILTGTNNFSATDQLPVVVSPNIQNALGFSTTLAAAANASQNTLTVAAVPSSQTGVIYFIEAATSEIFTVGASSSVTNYNSSGVTSPTTSSGSYIATGSTFGGQPTYFNANQTLYLWFNNGSSFWIISPSVGGATNTAQFAKSGMSPVAGTYSPQNGNSGNATVSAYVVNTLTNVTRGVGGTSAANMSAGAVITALNTLPSGSGGAITGTTYSVDGHLG